MAKKRKTNNGKLSGMLKKAVSHAKWFYKDCCPDSAGCFECGNNKPKHLFIQKALDAARDEIARLEDCRKVVGLLAKSNYV